MHRKESFVSLFWSIEQSIKFGCIFKNTLYIPDTGCTPLSDDSVSAVHRCPEKNLKIKEINGS
jgi:hypothetical protein